MWMKSIDTGVHRNSPFYVKLRVVIVDGQKPMRRMTDLFPKENFNRGRRGEVDPEQIENNEGPCERDTANKQKQLPCHNR